MWIYKVSVIVSYYWSEFRATLKPGNRNPDSGIGIRNPESGNRKPETGNRKPETGNRKPETGNRKPETGNRKPEIKENKFFKYAKII